MKIPKELYYISKRAGKAIGQYDMMHDGDKVLVAVSGGKDSLTLLDVLRYRQAFVPIHYELVVVHVDCGIPDFPIDKLKNHFDQREIPCHIETIDITGEKDWNDIDCFWCSWNRRKTLFRLADKFGCNKVALGHHMDDIIETILLNLFFQGEISAMKPKQELFEGKLTIIRPLALEEEQNIIHFAKRTGLIELDPSQCPHSDTSKRKVVKDFIRQLEKLNPDIRKNIFNSLDNIKTDYLLDTAEPTQKKSPTSKNLLQMLKSLFYS